MKIHISNVTANMLSENGMFEIVKRGELKIKGKGVMATYWLEGTKQDISSGQQSIKLQYFSHLGDEPDQGIEQKGRSNPKPDVYVKINHPDGSQDEQSKLPYLDGSQDEQSKLPCLDLIPLSSVIPSVQLYNTVHENVDI